MHVFIVAWGFEAAMDGYRGDSRWLEFDQLTHINVGARERDLETGELRDNLGTASQDPGDQRRDRAGHWGGLLLLAAPS